MFPMKCASDLTDTQSLFLHWAELYDWVFSLPETEKPHDRVIENDIAFDEWYKGYIGRKKGESRANAATGSSGRRKSAASHKNVIAFD